MDWITIQFIILAFGIGLLIGGLTSYYFMRRSLNKNIKSINDHFKDLTSQKDTKDDTKESRRENLLLLADKLKQIENNIQKIRRRELDNYINDLNQILDQTGITQIDNND